MFESKNQQETPQRHPLDDVETEIIRRAENGSMMLDALADLLEVEGAGHILIDRIRGQAEAIDEVTQCHPGRSDLRLRPHVISEHENDLRRWINDRN